MLSIKNKSISILWLCLCATSCQNWSTIGQGNIISEGGKKLKQTVKVGDHIDQAEKNLREVGLNTGSGVFTSDTAGGLTYRIKVDYGAKYWSAAKTAMQISEDLPPGRSPYGFVYADDKKIVYRVRP